MLIIIPLLIFLPTVFIVLGLVTSALSHKIGHYLVCTGYGIAMFYGILIILIVRIIIIF